MHTRFIEGYSKLFRKILRLILQTHDVKGDIQGQERGSFQNKEVCGRSGQRFREKDAISDDFLSRRAICVNCRKSRGVMYDLQEKFGLRFSFILVRMIS